MSRTVVITGGGTGIGRACAARFAGAGDRVFITGRRSEVVERTASEIGESVTAVAADSTDPEQIESLSRAVGEVDVLVNNSGGNTDFDRPEPTTLAEEASAWRSNLEANLVSAVLVTKALLPSMVDDGRIISIGSIAADKGADAYGAAKAAVASWNIDLARRVGQRGITANVISPGYIADTEFFRDNLSDDRRLSLIDAAFTKRAGAPVDIAESVFFIASAEAGQITGQTIAVNGGEKTTR